MASIWTSSRSGNASEWDKESYGIDLQAICRLVGDDFSSGSYLV